MKIFIKNMVCDRCKMVVDNELRGFGLLPLDVQLGEITLAEDSIDVVKESLIARLNALGFEWVDDKKSQLVERIKAVVIESIYQAEIDQRTNFSDFLSQKLQLEYNYLSNVFTEIETITIEKYLILQRIERVKEMILLDDKPLSEIAYLMNYSSVAYLSNQFKKTTGMTPTVFKKKGVQERKPLDNL